MLAKITCVSIYHVKPYSYSFTYMYVPYGCFALTDEAVFGLLLDMGPSAIDTELRALSPTGGGSFRLCTQFVRMCDVMLRTRKFFEFVQSCLGLFLKVMFSGYVRGNFVFVALFTNKNNF